MSVGIDIGTKSIKVVEMVRDSGKVILKAAGIIGVADASVEHLQNDVEYTNLAGIIKKLFESAKISSKEVNISLPESLVFTRTLRFPLLTDPEIESAVKWQAEDIIPIPLKESIFQYTIIEKDEKSQPPQVSVLVVAAPRVLVEKYVKLLSLAGLTVIGVETELLATVRSVAVEGQTVLVLNLGSKSTDIAIAKNNKLVFSRAIPTGGDALTRAISQSLGVSVAQAEEYKRTYGFSTTQLEGKVAAAITPVFKVVIEEVKKAIHFYQTDEKGDAPSLIILTGGGAGLPDMGSTITKAINAEVVVANPFSKVEIDQSIGKGITAYAPVYPVAVGLALRE
jgi:type IV pilus assembly protein PilM